MFRFTAPFKFPASCLLVWRMSAMHLVQARIHHAAGACTYYLAAPQSHCFSEGRQAGRQAGVPSVHCAHVLSMLSVKTDLMPECAAFSAPVAAIHDT